MTLSPIQFFLRYAFSCAYVLKDLGRISDDEYERVEKAAMNGEELPTEELEKVFPAAYRRLSIIAQKKGLHPWDKDVVMRYFPEYHNEFIDAGDGTYGQAPKWFCELCKVKELPVLSVRCADNKLFLLVEKGRWVQSPFFDAKVGDRVRVHHSYAVEKLT